MSNETKIRYVAVEPAGAFECDVPQSVVDQGDAAVEGFIDDAMVAAIPPVPASGQDEFDYRRAVDMVEQRKARKQQAKLPFGTATASRRPSRSTAATPHSAE